MLIMLPFVNCYQVWNNPTHSFYKKKPASLEPNCLDNTKLNTVTYISFLYTYEVIFLQNTKEKKKTLKKWQDTVLDSIKKCSSFTYN